MKKYLKKIAGAAKRGFSSVKVKTLAVLSVMGLAAASHAQDCALVAKNEAGEVSFSPEKLTAPIADALIGTYTQWAVIFLIIVGVGIIIWVLRKK